MKIQKWINNFTQIIRQRQISFKIQNTLTLLVLRTKAIEENIRLLIFSNDLKLGCRFRSWYIASLMLETILHTLGVYSLIQLGKHDKNTRKGNKVLEIML